MEEAIRSVAQLQNLLENRDAQFMRFETENRKATMHRIHGFVARFDNWIHFTDLPSPLDKVCFDWRRQSHQSCLGHGLQGGFSVLPYMSSSVVFYIRSNHLLGKLAPMCLIATSLVACLHGFVGTGSSSDGRIGISPNCAPRQSDFLPVPYAERSSILAAAMWLREILAPELDDCLGEDGYRTLADMQQCLDDLLHEGVLVPCIPPAIVTQNGLSSRSSSIASGTLGSQRRSFDRLVDKSLSVSYVEQSSLTSTVIG